MSGYSHLSFAERERIAVLRADGLSWRAIARRLGQTTDLGRILDPLADQVLVGGALFVLAMTGRVSMELAVVVILRDVALLGTAWVRMRAGAPVPSATPAGKVAFAALGFVMMVAGIAALAA